MNNWKEIQEEKDLDQVIAESFHAPQIIFKHSTRCIISGFVKKRITNQSKTIPEDTAIYYLDLIRYRNLSDQIAEKFGVVHESPQLLLISRGECVYNASHLDVSLDALQYESSNP